MEAKELGVTSRVTDGKLVRKGKEQGEVGRRTNSVGGNVAVEASFLLGKALLLVSEAERLAGQIRHVWRTKMRGTREGKAKKNTRQATAMATS